MKRYYIFVLFLIVMVLTSCNNDVIVPDNATGTLSLGVTRAGAASAQQVDDDMAIDILDSEGNVYVHYPSGSVPKRIVLEPGRFTVVAYTNNQNTWHKANNGLGEACYYATADVEIGFDQIAYLNMQVPLTNYAVTLTLPVLFDKLFKSYNFNLVSGTRSVNIREGEKAYFSVADKGFTYKLSATNTDNNTHHTTPITYKKVEAGKLYNLHYCYDTDANSGGIDIEITDNMEEEDEYVPL